MSLRFDGKICRHRSGVVARRVGKSVETLPGCDLNTEDAMFLSAAGTLAGIVFTAGTGMHSPKDDRPTYCVGCIAFSTDEASKCGGFLKQTNES